MTDSKTATKTELSLTRGAAALLISSLSLPWTKKVDDLYRCGAILDIEELNLARAPDPKDAEGHREWADHEVSVSLTDRQRETVRAAINHHIEAGGFPAGRHTNRLLRQIGLAGEE